MKTKKKKHTPLMDQPADYQITVHLENLKAHFGEEKIKNFLKEFYFSDNTQANKKPKIG